MKVKVIQNYVDKDTKELMLTGAEAEYEKERAEELIKEGFCEAVKKPAKKVK